MSSFVPERAFLLYHLVSKKWFVKWQAYTRCLSEEEMKQYKADPFHPGAVNSNIPDLRAITD